MGSSPWKAPRMWKGSTSYILGGGPSLNLVDLSLIHDRRCIGVNNSFLLGPWVDVCWWGDMKWLMWHRKTLLFQYHGLVASCNTNTGIIQRNSWVKFFRRGKPMGIDPRPGMISWNRNSGCSAINLAYHFGSTRIVLIGFDMQEGPSGETHWHGGHAEAKVKYARKQKMRKVKARTLYERFRQTTAFIARDAGKLGVEILNASPVSTIDVFPKVKLEDTL